MTQETLFWDTIIAEREAIVKKREHTLFMLAKNSVAIGDHTVNDLYNDINTAISEYTSAKDELEAIRELKLKLNP